MTSSKPQQGNDPPSESGSPLPHGEVMERVFESLTLGLIVFDQQQRILHSNLAADFLISGHETLDQALSAAIVDTRFQDWREELKKTVADGMEKRFDQVLYRDPEAGERLLNLLVFPLIDLQTGQGSGGTLVIEDVTAEVSMEKRLAVSERMAAVGKLAARVAHELNNPLDGILRYVNLALRAHEKQVEDKIPGYLQQARGGLLRMSEIVKELVEFSRSSSTAFEAAGLNNVVEEAVKVMSDKALANNVSIVCTLNENVPMIRGTNLFQVFCNLIKNAIDAMPDGGTLTITTKIVEQEVWLAFEDTGIGLPENMEQIFEPFFTTKEPGKGTGLGLAICRDIVEKYNGTITPRRLEDDGTVFTIKLPLQGTSIIRRPQNHTADHETTSEAAYKEPRT